MSKQTPTVSIGLPVYNGMPFLPAAIDTLLEQTWEDFELVVSDNASTDETPEVLRSYAAHDRRIRLHFNETNLGAAPNYNRVFEQSRGKYFKWAAADDTCAPSAIEKCVDALNANRELVLCYPRSKQIDSEGNVSDLFNERCMQLDDESAVRRFIWAVVSVRRATSVFGLIRREALANTCLIGSYPSSDLVLLAELALLGKFQEIPEHLFFKREHPLNSMQAYRTMEERAKWFNSNGAHGSIAPRWRLMGEYMRVVDRHVASRTQRAACYSALLDIVRRSWPKLCREAVRYATHPRRDAA